MNDESRPEAAPKVFGGTETSVTLGTDTLTGDAPLDLISCTLPEFLAFISGYRTGLVAGAEAEHQRREELDDAIYARAVKVVHAMAEILPHDELEARRRRRAGGA